MKETVRSNVLSRFFFSTMCLLVCLLFLFRLSYQNEPYWCELTTVVAPEREFHSDVKSPCSVMETKNTHMFRY